MQKAKEKTMHTEETTGHSHKRRPNRHPLVGTTRKIYVADIKGKTKANS